MRGVLLSSSQLNKEFTRNATNVACSLELAEGVTLPSNVSRLWETVVPCLNLHAAKAKTVNLVGAGRCST